MDEYEAALHQLASDTVAFGPVLAGQVTDKLESGYILRYGHRDYCGMGMAMNDAPFFRGNQVIFRKRLLDFISPDYPMLHFIWY